MGVSRQQAAENRSAIVAAAERLFRARGVDAVGLTELMKAAGFTQGGFYNHFKSKDALVAAVMEKAMQDRADSPAYPLPQQVARYLSAAHRDDVDAGCPLASFAGDAPRLGADARASYAGGLAAYLDRLAERMAAAHPSAHPPGRRDAIAAFSQMVGALLLSRAIADVDPALADEILEAGRQALADLSDGTARSA
ncbi:TetR/AcrR family transcriptional regulator [Burkholderia ubonensis]|uniref:TetR family transcriptional regulator n=1 Tax=Burkholderia ubonensis TaxID=101571 RepID=A0A103PJX8_9BURK|nr:TetR family transcriptional regulator [Burkholderia ubonensis]KVG32427.1 TetR family transcriptional regulator [Burkholderia ubonensis]KVP53985.1 TetR family transcriptional regulator [Burkholderia ubonensis]KWA86132.1 TetR family transcriptional regulator [Burkholderia ubonensis]OJA91179.1 TetR family transcriptional regulator [Burkholderia ubonensis]